MTGKRVLVINQLVVAVPDELQSADGREELTIDEILQWLLEYRKTANAVTRNNRMGNFLYFSMDGPNGCNPENPLEYNAQALMNYLNEAGPEKMVAGMMTALVYDEELGGYRNCYYGDEEAEFQVKKQQMLAQRAEEAEYYERAREIMRQDPERYQHCGSNEPAEDPEDSDEPSCPHCDEICSERCPDEPAVGQEDQESGDEE